MRAFIAHSYNEQREQGHILACLEKALSTCGFEAFSFVKSYPPYRDGDEAKMMDDAFVELLKSDLVVAEVSSKPIGVGIEVGYARAHNIPIVYLYSSGSELSKTVKGCASHVIAYADEEELEPKLREVLLKYVSQN